MRNSAEIGFGTNIGFVIIALHAKYNRNFTGMNIGFVTNALPAKYNRNRKGNEHRVCN